MYQWTVSRLKSREKSTNSDGPQLGQTLQFLGLFCSRRRNSPGDCRNVSIRTFAAIFFQGFCAIAACRAITQRASANVTPSNIIIYTSLILNLNFDSSSWTRNISHMHISRSPVLVNGLWSVISVFLVPYFCLVRSDEKLSPVVVTHT